MSKLSDAKELLLSFCATIFVQFLLSKTRTDAKGKAIKLALIAEAQGVRRSLFAGVNEDFGEDEKWAENASDNVAIISEYYLSNEE